MLPHRGLSLSLHLELIAQKHKQQCLLMDFKKTFNGKALLVLKEISPSMENQFALNKALLDIKNFAI